MQIISRYVIIGIVVGVLIGSLTLTMSLTSAATAQMGGMSGGMSHGSSDSSGGMMGSSGPSRHGVFYGPGTVHQVCHVHGDMPPHFCEPYYKAMSSVKGVRITNVDPINDNSIRVTLSELSILKSGVQQKITVNAGAGHLAGSAIVEGGWNDFTTVDIQLTGMGSVYEHESMHVHIFPMR